jgi:RNA polymerase sigma-70 factor (ECF subfamily)
MTEGAGEIMAAHRQVVRDFVRRLVGNEALAEDLTQETFLRVQRSDSAHRGEASERSWLCAIALNLVRDHFRAATRAPDATSDAAVLANVTSDEDIEQAALQREMSACIGEFLAQLPHPQYDVVALYDSAGLTHDEIAATLGISVANSRVLLHRGRTALREILKENCILSFDSDAIPCERRPPSAEGH